MKSKREPKAHPADSIAVIDFETDPFEHGVIPKPFCAGLAWTHKEKRYYRAFWGDDCAAQVVQYIYDRLKKPRMIYAHNGGKFDFLFMRDWIDNTDDKTGVRMIGARMVECKLGIHTLRDSFAILPVALKASGEKKEIDYAKMHRDCRDSHRAEILEYLEADCFALLNLTRAFAFKFSGIRSRKIPMTIGSAAEKALRSTLSQFDCPRLTPAQDADLRRFYFGGRVQCFETGAILSPLKSFDVNSMYPGVMRNYAHPNGRMNSLAGGALDQASKALMRNGTLGPKWAGKERVFFVRFAGWARHMPLRLDDGKTVYEGTGEYFACSHEIAMCFETRNIRIDKVHEIIVSSDTVNFSEFVDKFYSERLEAKAAGNVEETLFLKLVLNSAYGRFAINPERFRDTYITHGEMPPGEGWRKEKTVQGEMGITVVWRRTPDPEEIEKQYKNVAVAASITSAARAELARGIMAAKRVVYCDTDSITCEDFHGEIDPNTVGAWKYEGDYSEFHIAGKKTYAGKLAGSDKWKTACKGAVLSAPEIVRVAAGETITYKREAPTFSWLREAKFVVREITATA